jgi:hypothetical protein
MRQPLLLTTFMLAACSSAGGPYPSLQPRAAEAIDPRLQPVRPVNDRPTAPALASKLSTLVAQARQGDIAFQPAAANAEKLAAAAGAPQSESWIAAQQALSAAVSARTPTAVAQADIDALGATALQTQGGIAPNDLKAIDGAAAEVAQLAQAQNQRIDAVKRRLGI